MDRYTPDIYLTIDGIQVKDNDVILAARALVAYDSARNRLMRTVAYLADNDPFTSR